MLCSPSRFLFCSLDGILVDIAFSFASKLFVSNLFAHMLRVLCLARADLDLGDDEECLRCPLVFVCPR